MAWLVALPGFVAAAVLLMVPGLLLAWAIGLRGVWALSLAPVLTSSLVAASTVACWWLDIEWHLGVFSLVTVLLCGLVLGATRLLARRWPETFLWRPVANKVTAGYLAALLVSGTMLTIRYAQIIEQPGNINQGIDTPFHLNLAQQILRSGDGSPYSVRGLMGEETGLYPQIWHALVALLAGATSLPVVEAANALNLVVIAVAWPLGVSLLVYVVCGPKTAAFLFAGVASAGFFAFPFTLLQSQKSDFGPLFPYMTAVTFLPPLMSVAASALKFGRGGFMPWPMAGATFAIGLLGLVSTHMSAVVALAGLIWPFALIAGYRSARQLFQRQADPLKFLQWTARWVTASAAVLIVWVAVRPFTTTWDPIDSLPAAILSVLVTAPTHGTVAWGFALLTLLGTGLAMRQPAERWLLAAYAGAVALYLVAAAAPDPLLRRIIIGAWYGDPPRLAALLPMFWVVLVGLAGGWIVDHARHGRSRGLIAAGLAALAASVIIVPTNSETTPGRERTYAFAASSPLITPDELALIKRLSLHVPPDAVIANNPWDGSSTAYAIADRRVLFAHAYTGSNKDRLLTAEKLNEATPGSAVCAAARRENVQFLLDFGEPYIDPKRKEVNDFPGLEVPGDSAAFVEVDHQGSAKLYRFVGCEQ